MCKFCILYTEKLNELSIIILYLYVCYVSLCLLLPKIHYTRFPHNFPVDGEAIPSYELATGKLV